MRKLFTLLTIITTSCIFAQIPSYVPTDGLVAYYPFNGNANDVSGNDNNGVVNGATLTADRLGNNNSSYSFDGTSNYILVNNSVTLNNPSISISGWFNTNTLPTDIQGGARAIVAKWFQQKNCNANGESFIVELAPISNSSTVVAATKYYSQTSFYAQGQSIGTNTWYHFVLTHNSQTGGSLYINGVLVSTNNLAGDLCNTTNPIYIGADNFGTSLWRYFNGKIDDIGIWNRTLTQEEITNLYYADTTCQSLVINTGTLSYNPPTYNNTVTIYPNPAKDHITIDCGKITNVVGWNIKITNSLGQEVFNQPMNTQQYVVPLNTWGGTGVYFVKIYDAQDNVLNTKKIILQ